MVSRLNQTLHNRQTTVHGLDFGIPAEMTAFPACPDLCMTMSGLRGNASSDALRHTEVGRGMEMGATGFAPRRLSFVQCGALSKRCGRGYKPPSGSRMTSFEEL